MERAAKARTAPLDRDEEAAWRAIARAVLVVPRTLDADLLAGCALSAAAWLFPSCPLPGAQWARRRHGRDLAVAKKAPRRGARHHKKRQASIPKDLMERERSRH